MILWHLGGTLLVVRYVFRDPEMDLRWVLAGSLLPDVIDKPIGSVLFHDTFGTHRLFGHALMFPVVLLVAALLATRRGTALRKGTIGLAIGVFIHLLLDGAWTGPEGFFWPLFGLDFPRLAGSDFVTLVGDMVRSPFVWAGEAAGLGYLVWLWAKYLRRPGGLRSFLRSGKIPMPSRSVGASGPAS